MSGLVGIPVPQGGRAGTLRAFEPFTQPDDDCFG
jgi:hypothetical protein